LQQNLLRTQCREQALLKATKCALRAHQDARGSRPTPSDADGRLAKEVGVKVAISTDAQSRANLDDMRFGVDQARRGWLEAEDVVNTRPLEALRKLPQRA
jgi:DNA polymerase (family 10)